MSKSYNEMNPTEHRSSIVNASRILPCRRVGIPAGVVDAAASAAAAVAASAAAAAVEAAPHTGFAGVGETSMFELCFAADTGYTLVAAAAVVTGPEVPAADEPSMPILVP